MMGQAQKAAPKVSEAEVKFTQQLVSRGYDDAQAKQILDIVQRMRQGQNVRLSPAQSTWINDINTIADRWNDVSPSTTRVAQLKPRDVVDMLAGRIKGPPEAPKTREEPKPAQVRTFVYDVTVDGSRYRIETRAELQARGMTTVQGSRMGQLATMLRDNPKGILAVTAPDGSVAASGSPGFEKFNRAYITAYNATLRDPEADRIEIASVRKKAGEKPNA
jgi:hypothetical protein